MIYVLVLHILASTDDGSASFCTSSLVLHILTCTAHPDWHIVYTGSFLSGVLKKRYNISGKRVHFESSWTNMPFSKFQGVDTIGYKNHKTLIHSTFIL